MKRLPHLCIVACGFWTTLFILGCASTTPNSARVTLLHEADPAAAALVAYLQSRDVPVIKTGEGVTRIDSSAQSCQALIRFMEIARLRMDVCAGNIANQNATRDVNGKPMPYRRRLVVLTAGGVAQTCVDESQFTQRYQPGHPDADAAGFVRYPNIDMTIECIDAGLAAVQYEMAATVLRRLDPEIVISQPVPTPPLATNR